MKSMTGFASLARDTDEATIGVTVRTLNHRYLDLQLRMPQAFGELEGRIRSLVQRHVARGRVEITVAVQMRQSPSVDVSLNEPFAAALGSAIEAARAQGVVNGPLTPGDLLRFPQAVSISDQSGRTEQELVRGLAERVATVVEDGLTAADRMRIVEGEHLRGDLEKRRHDLARLADRIAAAAEEGRASLEAKLSERVRELTADVTLDPAVVAQEIIRTAARSDISEEIARFRGHLAHWSTLVDAADACGRKLDFLLQEMNREINTMGAKADGLSVSELIIDAKAQLEKMREQVQNVE